MGLYIELPDQELGPHMDIPLCGAPARNRGKLMRFSVSRSVPNKRLYIYRIYLCYLGYVLYLSNLVTI
jgi:hypothetical protein